MKRAIGLCLVMSMLVTAGALGQQSPSSTEFYKHRTIWTIVGGAGGFTLGLVAGLSAFDDATDSDRKVWTTAVLSGAGGAIGGYFLGRALDKRAGNAGSSRVQNGKASTRAVLEPANPTIQRDFLMTDSAYGTNSGRALLLQLKTLRAAVKEAVQ